METLPKQQEPFTPESIDLIKNTVAKGATDQELKLFLYQANKTGLDPLARQIYFIKRGAQVTIQTSIDGFRIIAERSGNYAGQDAPQFEQVKGWLNDAADTKCSVNIYKFAPNGQRYVAAVGVAYWSEYCPPKGQDFMWLKMPKTMLAKVAEALGLRKAFPQDLSGIYTTDEMQQAKTDEESNGKVAQTIDAKTGEVLEQKESTSYDSNDDLGMTKSVEENRKKNVMTPEEMLNEAKALFDK